MSLLTGTRYPLVSHWLPLLLAAAAADGKSGELSDDCPLNSERATAFAQAFPFACHLVPQNFSGFGKRCELGEDYGWPLHVATTCLARLTMHSIGCRLYIGQRYLTEAALSGLGKPSIALPSHAQGEWVEQVNDPHVNDDHLFGKQLICALTPCTLHLTNARRIFLSRLRV